MLPTTITPTESNSPLVDDALPARIRSFIASPSEGDFDELALAAHRYQYRLNPPYRRFVDRLGARPRTWREIPPVPAVAFRETTLSCGPAQRVYESSGTTRGPARRARHHIPDAAFYRLAALGGFQREVLPAGERRPFLVAAPERSSHPFSSLGDMVSWIREAHDSDQQPSFVGSGGLDCAGFLAAIAGVKRDRPVVVLAVTAALLRVIDLAHAERTSIALPPGSLIVDTGGCKGYTHDVGRDAILGRYESALGVPVTHVINEYGMTELCSQLYARGRGALSSPPWMRTLVCDPGTGAEVPPGACGLLRHVDLANLGSVIAVQTEDIGRAVDGGIELVGRIPGAVRRGCSLVVGS